MSTGNTHTEFTIRAATPADIPAMRSLEVSAASAAHWSNQAYEEIFNIETGRITLVATATSGALCGFTVARIIADECELENIVVAERHRRNGIGRALLQAIIATAREKKTARVMLEVRESNRAARDLYESCGFTISNRRKSYYSPPSEDALIFTMQP